MKPIRVTAIEAASAVDVATCIEAVAELVPVSSKAACPHEPPAPPQLPPATAPSPAKKPPPPDDITPGPVQLRLACGRAVGYNAPSSIFAVESESFSGRVYYVLRGLPDEPLAYLAARKGVRMAAIVQGRFTTTGLTMADCCTGFEFAQPLAYVPARFVVRALLKAAHLIAPALTENILGPRPYILNPLFETVQRLHVAAPGGEPPIDSILEEETHLLGGPFALAAPMPSAKRKAFFSSARNGARHPIDPGLVYTMEFSEDKVDATTFELLLIGMRFKLRTYLGDQPLPYPMGKLGFTPHEGEYLWNVRVHHQQST